MIKKIAIIGAGISGLNLASNLSKIADVKIFEKARGVGGRMATRYFNDGENYYQFDHGAQFFKANSKIFRDFLKEFEDINVVSRWNANFVEIDGKEITKSRIWNDKNYHFIGTSKMNQLCKEIAAELSDKVEINLNCQISKIVVKDNKVSIFDGNQSFINDFDFVISAIPVQQFIDIADDKVNYKNDLKNIKMLPCYSLMLSLAEYVKIDFDAALVKNSKISWITKESSKINRPDLAFTILSSNLWAQENIDNNKEDVAEQLVAEFSRIINIKPEIKHQNLHLWRYANSKNNYSNNKFYIDYQSNVASCGDWCIKGFVEAAFMSSFYLACDINSHLKNLE